MQVTKKMLSMAAVALLAAATSPAMAGGYTTGYWGGGAQQMQRFVMGPAGGQQVYNTVSDWQRQYGGYADWAANRAAEQGFSSGAKYLLRGIVNSNVVGVVVGLGWPEIAR